MVKNRTQAQTDKHRDYMKKYYQNNKEKREKNKAATVKRGLVKVPCSTCNKMITRMNMKRHVRSIHEKKELIIIETE